jgi:predicted RNA binding protein YcfA (HicA-like mRNA interferase family)
MKTLGEAQFLDWAAGKGLHLDPQYPQSAVLTFHGASEARFWQVPFEPHRRPHFLDSLLKLLGDWEFCCVRRHMGSWPSAVDPRCINDVVELQILTGLGLPLGTARVVAVARDELEKLVTLIFSTTIFGWSVGEDLYKVREVIRLLETECWVLVSTEGSHRQFKHPTKLGRVTVSGGLGDDMPKGTLASVKRQAGLKGSKS